MEPDAWHACLDASADPQRARQHFELLPEADRERLVAALAPNAARAFAAVLAGSAALSTLLARRPDWLELFHNPDDLGRARRMESLRREVNAGLSAALDAGNRSGALDGLHEVRLHELLRIGSRDLARLGTLPDILLEISNAADTFLDGILRIVWSEHIQRFGAPYHQDVEGQWQPSAFCVFGMGKLGGQELNYSSDVDLLFVYTEEGAAFRTPPTGTTATGQGLPSHQFFRRLCEAFIKEASARGPEGGGLRIDMRLRPEGPSGPLARSLDSYETYYAQSGQSWERMMLLKARRVAGDRGLAEEFVGVVQPFRYPRLLSDGVFAEMARMRARIESEVVRAGELDRNVKLGRGGIREIEFVAQVLQVLQGGRQPFLQTHQTLPALARLAEHGFLGAEEAAALKGAYPFLRDVEHRLQMDGLRQTHTLPSDPAVLLRIARSMGFPGIPEFQAEHTRHRQAVRAIYEAVFRPATAIEPPSELPGDFDADAVAWRECLVRHRFRDPDKGVRMLRTLVEGPGFVHVAPRTGELGRAMIARFLALCPQPGAAPPSGADGFVLSDPDRVLVRLDSYIAAYGARGTLYELWDARQDVYRHILKLFDRSEFLAELAIRVPDIVDDLVVGGHIPRQKNTARTLEDLRFGAGDADQHLWLRRYFQTEFMRLGLRDLVGLVTYEEANAELTTLAEACVQYAIEVVTRRHGLAREPFAAIALGKFGGLELVYGSDLDLLFVAPNSTADLPRLQKFAGETIDLLSARTEQGSVFVLDTRLRPDGEKGLLVNTLQAHEDYYRQRAMLWEIQALTRARHVAGDPETGAAFEALARRLTDFRHPSLPLSAHRLDWKAEIARMRLRIERERTPRGQEALAFKTGAGGLVDVEFITQALAMEHGWFAPNTRASLEEARQRRALAEEDADTLIVNFRHLRRMESILRRWSFEGEAVLPADPAPQYRVAVRCGYADAEAFLRDVATWRAAVRRVYERAFHSTIGD